jgi:malate permease and related proteins
MEILFFALNAILPIILLGLLGYTLKKFHHVDQPFLVILNRYIFYVALPFLLFLNIYNIESFSAIDWIVIFYVVVLFVSFFMIGILFVKKWIKQDNQKGVLLLSFIRVNFALIGIPLVSALGGESSLQIYALLIAFTIPLTNIMSIMALMLFKKNQFGERISFKFVLISIFKNPLIIAISLGFISLFFREMISLLNEGEQIFVLRDYLPAIYEAFSMISVTASPMALIALGGQFEFFTIKKLANKIAIGVTTRILIIPAIALVTAYFLIDKVPGFSTAFPALIAIFGAPVAISSVIVVQQLGGDEALSRQIVVWSTLFSILTIFAFTVLFKFLAVF